MILKTSHSMLLAALFASASLVHAQTAAPAPAPGATPTAAPAATSPFSFNVGVVSDYRFRGISQTRLGPALQGGVDWAHDSGFYLGTWLSTIRILEDIPGGRGAVEWDIYGGYKGKINETFTYDVGVLRYQYPRQNFPTTVNTTEIYGAVSAGPATVKYSHSVGRETFGVPRSRGTFYLEAAATFELGSGFALTPHVGWQKYTGSVAGVSNNSFATYVDYSLTVTKDLGNGFSLSGAVVGTDTSNAFYASGANNKNLGRTGVVVGAKYTF